MRRPYPYLEPLRLPHACAQLADEIVDPDSCLWYLPWAREYVMERHDVAVQGIDYCPFCGERLPGSLRDEYWERQDDDHELTPGFDAAGDAWWVHDPRLAVPTVRVEPDVPLPVVRPAHRVERTTVHVVRMMIDGRMRPDDASDWAVRVLEEDDERDDLDECLYRLIECVALAEDLPVEYGGPLYTVADFQHWLDVYQGCRHGSRPRGAS